MSKIPAHLDTQPQYVLIVRDGRGDKINSAISPHDLEGSQKMAQQVMRLMAEAAFIDIYLFVEPFDLAAAQPLEVVYQDGMIRHFDSLKV